jgi:hypothetical protein
MNDAVTPKSDKAKQAPIRPDFATFDEGITIPSSWLNCFSRLRLIHSWLIISSFTILMMSRAGENLTLLNLVAGLGGVLLTGVIAAVVELNGKDKERECEEAPKP